MVPHPAALDLPHALVEWVSMLIVTREGDRRCKLTGVLPRGRGEQRIRRQERGFGMSPSPRARGAVARHGHRVSRDESFPAGAGSSSSFDARRAVLRVLPRGRGEQPF